MLGKNLRTELGVREVERRQGKRFALRLRCRVTFPWLGSRQLKGFTCNMSRSGVLVTFDEDVLPDLTDRNGEAARISIDLPHSPNFTPRCLVCLTRIVRVADATSAKRSVAFQIFRTLVEDRDKQASDQASSVVQWFVSSSVH